MGWKNVWPVWASNNFIFSICLMRDCGKKTFSFIKLHFGQIRSTFTSHFHTANVTHFKIWEKKKFWLFLCIFLAEGEYIAFFFSHLTVTVKERLFASSRAKAASWILERYVFLTLWREKFFQKWSSKKEDCNNLYSVYHIYLIVCLFS